jgi:hypothetical protein
VVDELFLSPGIVYASPATWHDGSEAMGFSSKSICEHILRVELIDGACDSSARIEKMKVGLPFLLCLFPPDGWVEKAKKRPFVRSKCAFC